MILKDEFSIRHSRPRVSQGDVDEIERVLLSGDVSGGEAVSELESRFREMTGAKRSLAFNSWTSAAYAYFSALAKRRPNSTVILPSFSFAATANVVANAGLEVVFADVNDADGSLDFDSVSSLLNENVSAIMTVHYAGIFGRDTLKIKNLCDSHGIAFVEDAAEALGAYAQDGITMAGSLGVGIFSFFATKNITCGEGGMITLNDVEIADQIESLRGHGIKRNLSHPWQRNAVLTGHNFRLSNLNAALAVSQLCRLEELNTERRLVASRYLERLSDLPWLRIMGEKSASLNSWQMFPVIIETCRNEIVYAMLEHGIEASVHFDPPIHAQDAFKDLGVKSSELPITESLSASIITLPMHGALTRADVDLVCETLVTSARDLL